VKDVLVEFGVPTILAILVIREVVPPIVKLARRNNGSGNPGNPGELQVLVRDVIVPKLDEIRSQVACLNRAVNQLREDVLARKGER